MAWEAGSWVVNAEELSSSIVFPIDDCGPVTGTARVSSRGGFRGRRLERTFNHLPLGSSIRLWCVRPSRSSSSFLLSEES